MNMGRSTVLFVPASARRLLGRINREGFFRFSSSLVPPPISKRVYFRQATDEKASRNYLLLIVPVTTFCLGTWQLYRLKWKLGLIDERSTRMRIAPLTMEELPDDLEKIRDLEYRLVKVTGEFDHSREIYLVPRSPVNSVGGGLVSNTSSHGAHVVTPFKVSGTSTTILVDRGWVPKRNMNPEKREHAQVTGQLTITGVLRNSERKNNFSPDNKTGSKEFLVRNIDEMAAAVNTAPVYLDLTKENDIPGGPAGGQTIVQIRNEHLNYAITWYTLSALTAILWYFKYVKRRSFIR